MSMMPRLSNPILDLDAWGAAACSSESVTSLWARTSRRAPQDPTSRTTFPQTPGEPSTCCINPIGFPTCPLVPLPASTPSGFPRVPLCPCLHFMHQTHRVSHMSPFAPAHQSPSAPACTNPIGFPTCPLVPLPAPTPSGFPRVLMAAGPLRTKIRRTKTLRYGRLRIYSIVFFLP